MTWNPHDVGRWSMDHWDEVWWDFFDNGTQRPPTGSQADLWLKEGRCPECGELGAYIRCKAVCSTHGPYPKETR